MSGYRPLIRIAEAKTAEEARREVAAIFGERIAAMVVIVPSPKGSSRLYCWHESCRDIPPDGYRALIPKSFRWERKAA